MRTNTAASIQDLSVAERLLKQQTRSTYGPVPRELDGVAVNDGSHRLAGDAFLLRTGKGLNFLYRKDEGIVIERVSNCDPSDEALWLNGSVYAAIASICGFKPLHASAVAHRGKVFAFSGPSGAGKSTMIAALGARGFPMFCDDTLVLDLSAPSMIVCLPGHKRLKLTEEALVLTGAAREEKVAVMVDKFYAKPLAGDVGTSLPLAGMVFLEDGPEPLLEPLTGARRLAYLNDDHYTTDFFVKAHRFDLAGLFAKQSRIANQIAMSRLVRPRDVLRFSTSVELAAEYISTDRGEL